MEESQEPGHDGVASGKGRNRPPLLDDEVSTRSESEATAAAYAAVVGLTTKDAIHAARSLPSSLSSLNNQKWHMRAFESSIAEVLYEEVSPVRAGSPRRVGRSGRSLTEDLNLADLSLGRSPPLSPTGEAPIGDVDVPHDALHVGPLDFASSFGGVNPAVVYVRLSNFAARRRGSLRMRSSKEAEEDLEEPFSPVLHCNSLEAASFNLQSALQRRRSGSELSQSSTLGSSPQLQAGRENSGEDFAGAGLDERAKEALDESERHSPHERWSDRKTDVLPEQFAEEEEEIASIQRHLEAMNAAAADLNAAQESLNACLKRQRSLVQLWAVVSARLARAVGSHHIAKAKLNFEKQSGPIERDAQLR
ncbi:unnamed protein product [Effrenium voratum]|nr:unnamed protein product [Effrenium voratum]